MAAVVAHWGVMLLRRAAEVELEEAGDWLMLGGFGTE